MATKAKKTSKTAKRRLALPAGLIKNLESARKNYETYKKKGSKEVEKLVHKVIEIDFVKKVRKHKMVKQATKTGTDFSKEVESRVKKLHKELDSQMKNLRSRIPIPSRSEIEQLSRKVNQLSKKVDEISGERRSVAAG